MQLALFWIYFINSTPPPLLKLQVGGNLLPDSAKTLFPPPLSSLSLPLLPSLSLPPPFVDVCVPACVQMEDVHPHNKQRV